MNVVESKGIPIKEGDLVTPTYRLEANQIIFYRIICGLPDNCNRIWIKGIRIIQSDTADSVYSYGGTILPSELIKLPEEMLYLDDEAIKLHIKLLGY